MKRAAQAEGGSLASPARFQEEKGVQPSFDWVPQAQKVDAATYREAKRAVDKGIDPKIGDIHVWQVWPYHRRGPPQLCPICDARRERFQSLPV